MKSALSSFQCSHGPGALRTFDRTFVRPRRSSLSTATATGSFFDSAHMNVPFVSLVILMHSAVTNR
ncbi:hypothetical protein GCM10017744_077820 [Streptomyces antimycoticus]|uniref:Uncharacterized protein n=1 Tax=Streptomyces antimycoticus TaxID=68175 RepID=A0A4D4K443_9ACTN|nr:hypothetical protein SANT12839_023580 [Streptomyces antimycoticus]